MNIDSADGTIYPFGTIPVVDSGFCHFKYCKSYEGEEHIGIN
jgi:hypothetical protein